MDGTGDESEDDEDDDVCDTLLSLSISSSIISFRNRLFDLVTTIIF
jgi:hypothetical protein